MQLTTYKLTGLILSFVMLLSFSWAGLSRNTPILRMNDITFDEETWISRSVSRSFDGGNFTYRIPEEFARVEISDEEKPEIFNVNAGDCNAYMLNGLTLDDRSEILCIFFFDNVKYLMYESDAGETKDIEYAIINNILPDEFGFLDRLVDKVDPKIYYSISVDGRSFDHYVGIYGNHRVEFAFTKVDGGMCVLMYIYDEGHNYVDDICYVLHSISEKGE